MFIGDEKEREYPLLTPLRAPRRSFSVWRIIMGPGLILSFMALASSLYDQNTLTAAIFGFATIVFLGLLTYPTKPRRA